MSRRKPDDENPFALTDELLARDGGLVMPWYQPARYGPVDEWWYVEGRCTVGERAGSTCGYGLRHPTPGEANAHRDRLMADPEETAKYDTWLVLHCQPLLRTTLVDSKAGDPGEPG